MVKQIENQSAYQNAKYEASTQGLPVAEVTIRLFQHENLCRICLFVVYSDSLKDSKSAWESDPVHPVQCEQDQAEGKVMYQNSFR